MPLLIYIPVDPTERYDLVKAHPSGVQLQRIGMRAPMALLSTYNIYLEHFHLEMANSERTRETDGHVILLDFTTQLATTE